MSIIAWIVLGAIAGYLAGFIVKGDEGLGIIGHIVLGIVGALVGGFLAGVLFNSNPIDGALDISSIVVATIGAVITVVVVSAVTSRTRTGSGSDLTQPGRLDRRRPSGRNGSPSDRWVACRAIARRPAPRRSSATLCNHRARRGRPARPRPGNTGACGSRATGGPGATLLARRTRRARSDPAGARPSSSQPSPSGCHPIATPMQCVRDAVADAHAAANGALVVGSSRSRRDRRTSQPGERL